jgi:hypothetical protein
MSEQDLVRACLQYLEIKKNRGELMYWRNNTGAIVSEYKGKKRFMKFGAKGSPDIFVLKDGILIGVECKYSTKQSDDQKSFQKEMEKNGGKYLLVYEIEELLLKL